MAFHPTNNGSNFRIYKNGSIIIYGPGAGANNCNMISNIITLAANDIIKVDNDASINDNFYNASWYIWEIQLNKKIVNNTVNLGTSLELLSDTDIINKQNKDIL